jgi:L-alanine-DL-glutamate epimerase-like enolase superfamily enzyme
MKIAAMADAFYVNIARTIRTDRSVRRPHCTSVSIPNFVILEQGATDTSMYKEFFAGGWTPSNTEMRVPETPGLGLDFSPQFVKENSVSV